MSTNPGNQEILNMAIEKAIAGGWQLPDESWVYKIQSDRIIILTSMAIGEDGQEEPGTWRISTNEIIFSPDFAKALWGEGTDTGYEYKCKTCLCDTVWYVPTWQYHLQQMAVAEDPIKYLGDNL